MAIERGLDDITDLFGKSILLELCSSQLDPVPEVSPVNGFSLCCPHEFNGG
ncbi:hypothetical protein L195_g041451 [Trifolium pratense]|uniref:Uncharacterized protein n=1 Tax=Trifolium pratense TaxID=57577 RepID=A0A2K3M3K9_TRIPR|nr:hypothetical protein L195_g041451 [Trifolium pratense]